MKLACLDNENKIINIILGSVSLMSDSCKFLSDKSELVIGDLYDETLANAGETPPVPLIPVVIDGVSNQLTGFKDAERQYTVSELSESLATGQLAIPDQKFRVPFLRVDTGRVQIMPTEVKGGQFSITLNFKTGGKWVVNQELLNSELPTPIFSIEEHTFWVI